MKIIPKITVADHVASLVEAFAKSVTVPKGVSLPPLPDFPCAVKATTSPDGFSFHIEIQPSPDLLT